MFVDADAVEAEFGGELQLARLQAHFLREIDAAAGSSEQRISRPVFLRSVSALFVATVCA